MSVGGGRWPGECSGRSSFSSSNGRSNRSDIGQVLELVCAVADAFDIGRTAGLFVAIDDDGVQPRIATRGIELGGKRRQKFAERRVDLDADDRIVRPGHANVGKVRGTLREDP